MLYLYSTNNCSPYVPIKSSWNPGYSTATMNYVSDNVCTCRGTGGQLSECQNRQLKKDSYDQGNTEYSDLKNSTEYKSTNFNNY